MIIILNILFLHPLIYQIDIDLITSQESSRHIHLKLEVSAIYHKA